MSQISQLEARSRQALDRLRAALAARDAAAGAARRARRCATASPRSRREKAALADELERLRAKRDKDVAALDDLIAQLKPLIEEV